MAFEEAPTEDIKKSEEDVIGNWGKGNPHGVRKFGKTVTCGDVDGISVSSELDHVAKESFPRQSVEVQLGFFLLLMENVI